MAYLWLIGTRLTKHTDLLLTALLVPLYWVMMSIAAVKGLVQLVISPSYWEKTMHGLHLGRGRDVESREDSPRAGGALVNVVGKTGTSH
jgi:hypothetical protein